MERFCTITHSKEMAHFFLKGWEISLKTIDISSSALKKNYSILVLTNFISKIRTITKLLLQPFMLPKMANISLQVTQKAV